MYFDPAKCVHCGKVFHTVPQHQLNDRYGFCTTNCLMGAVTPYLSPQYAKLSITAMPTWQMLSQESKQYREATKGISELKGPEPIAHRKHHERQKLLREHCEHELIDLQWQYINLALQEYAKRWNAHHNHLITKENEKEQARINEQLRKQGEREAEQQRKLQERDAEARRKQHEKYVAEQAERQAFQDMIRPRPIPDEPFRFEHTHIIGPSGSGKSTLLQHIFLEDLKKPNPPAYIIIDPKGTLVERISRLAVFDPHFGSLKDRLVILDPEQAPALAVFQSTNSAQMISTFSYIFSTTKQKLTGKQDTCFSFCVGLLFGIPGADLFTLLDLLDDQTEKKPPNPLFQAAISKLTAPSQMAQRRFFETDFYATSYASTRQEIKTRVWEVLKNEYLFPMLNAPTLKLDTAACIRERKILLVNTRMSQLKTAHQTLGRYILSLAVNAIQGRKELHPVYWPAPGLDDTCLS